MISFGSERGEKWAMPLVFGKTAHQQGGGTTYLTEIGSEGSAPRVDVVVLAGGGQPLPIVGEFEGEHAVLMHGQLVALVVFRREQLDEAFLEADRDPLARIAEGEYLRLERVVVQWHDGRRGRGQAGRRGGRRCCCCCPGRGNTITIGGGGLGRGVCCAVARLSKHARVPTSHNIVQATGPQIVALQVHARGAVGVARKLPHHRLVVDVPHENVPVRVAAVAEPAVPGQSQRVAGDRVRP